MSPVYVNRTPNHMHLLACASDSRHAACNTFFNFSCDHSVCTTAMKLLHDPYGNIVNHVMKKWTCLVHRPNKMNGVIIL